MRTILHCDCNSFFASVELLEHPQLRSQPVAVCGDPKKRHGVILAKNEPAKAMGVVTGEAVWLAQQKCPGLQLLPPHRDRYVHYSRCVNAIYERYTSQIEPFGIDESWLDVTGSLGLFGCGQKIADRIRQQVRDELGLTLSIGVSYNKIFAKLGSDYRKPDATTLITPENFSHILHPLPVMAMLYVGKAASQQLSRVGIKTIGDLARADEALLLQLLGRQGPQLKRYAQGQDDSPVQESGADSASKSIGKGLTFAEDLASLDAVKTQALWLSDQVAMQLRQAGLVCQAVQVSIKNPQLKTITRQKTLPCPIASTRTLYEAAVDLVEQHWTFRQPIRMLTVTALQLGSPGQIPVQLSLFDGPTSQASSKHETVEASMDDIRSRYGNDAVTFGRILKRRQDDPDED